MGERDDVIRSIMNYLGTTQPEAEHLLDALMRYIGSAEAEAQRVAHRAWLENRHNG